MTCPVTFTHQDRIGLLCIDNPPVNAMSPQAVAALIEGFDRFERSDFSAAPYNRLLARIENSRRPVVAALHGTVLGGGLELAMACHWRVAQPDTRFGLPEVK